LQEKQKIEAKAAVYNKKGSQKGGSHKDIKLDPRENAD